MGLNLFERVQKAFTKYRTFVIGGSVIVGGYVGYNYLCKWLEERSYEKRQEEAFRRRYFGGTINTFDENTVGVCKLLHSYIRNQHGVDEIINLLRNNPDNKIQLWNQLKIATFATACSIVYAETLYLLMIRIQQAILGATAYKNNFRNRKEEMKLMNNKFVDHPVQEEYLFLSMHFVHTTLHKFCDYMLKKVSQVLENIALTDKLNKEAIRELFLKVQSIIMEDPDDPFKNIENYIQNTERYEHLETLHQLVCETVEIFKCDEIANFLYSSVNLGFNFLTEKLIEIQNSDGSKFPVAKLIPSLNNIAKKGEDDFTYTWAAQLMPSHELKILFVNIYEAFSH